MNVIHAMPVDGLPNPRIHHLCRRCGKWFHEHEGSSEPPPVLGPVSWWLATSARIAGHERQRRFLCTGCRSRGRSFWSLILQLLLGAGAAYLVVRYAGLDKLFDFTWSGF